VTGCAAYEQDPARTAGIFPLPLRLLNAFACFEPLERQLEFRISEARSRFSLTWALVVLVVRFPRDVDDLHELRMDLLELGIGEALTESTLELVACQLDVSLTSPYVDHRFDLHASGCREWRTSRSSNDESMPCYQITINLIDVKGAATGQHMVSDDDWW